MSYNWKVTRHLAERIGKPHLAGKSVHIEYMSDEEKEWRGYSPELIMAKTIEREGVIVARNITLKNGAVFG